MYVLVLVSCVHADQSVLQSEFFLYMKMPLKIAFRPCHSYRSYQQSVSVCLCIFLCSHMQSVCPSNLVAVVETHAAEGGQFGLQTVVSRLLLLMVELLPLDLLPHAPGLLDGLHHRVLVPKQRRGVEAGQDVWGGLGERDNCHFA